MKIKYLILPILMFVVAACTPSTSQLKKAMEENPEILTNAIEKNPKKVMEALNKAVREAQKKEFEDRQANAVKARESEFNSPKKPEVNESRAIAGNKDAKVTIIEYSDFECPFCRRGYNTVKKVKEKYGDKVRFMFKHLPLDFHPMAMPAAKYFEAIAKQDHDKAYKFHSKIFEKQSELKGGKEKFLKSIAKQVGADMKKLAKDLDSEEVRKNIEADMAEAKKFGFSGTPGYLINGVSIKGAEDISVFEQIIDKHLAK